MTPQNDRKTWFTVGGLGNAYPSNYWRSPKIQFFVLWDHIIPKLQDFPYLVNRRSYKVGWLLKMTTRMDLLWKFLNMYIPRNNWNCPQNTFFKDLVWWIWKVSISRELHILPNWLTFYKDREIHLNGKWAKIRISDLFMNEIFRISFETSL